MKKQVLLILWIAFFIETQATIRYVTPTGTGSGTGSWANSSPDLQLMINNSAAGDAVWIAAGTYVPIRPANNLTVIDSNNRGNAFVLKADVLIFGGFAGNETYLAQRNWNANPTILSGDIGFVGTNSDNCYRVVISSGPLGTACLDGFTITKGNASGNYSTMTINGYLITTDRGGGIFCTSGSFALTNVTISENYAIYGGGIFIYYGSPTLTNVTISGNNATFGGGIYFEIYSYPTLTNVTISGNNAGNNGGGMNLGTYTSSTLTNVTISGNSANSGGGFFCNSTGYFTLTNVTISGNYAYAGGGISCTNYYDPSIIRNSILWGNTATTSGNNVNGGSGNPIYINSIVEGSSGGWVNFGADGGMNLDDDPLFVVPVSASYAPTTEGDYRLELCSPAINAGNNDYLMGITTDLDGNPRIVNDIVDLGAYECQWVYIPDTIQLAPLSLTYSGTGQSPMVTTTNGTSIASIFYKEKGSSDLNYTSTLPVNAGNYTIKAYLPVVEMCDTVTDMADFVILPKQLTISNPTSHIKVYDGNIVAIVTPGVLSGIVGNDTVTVSATANYDNKNVGTNKTIVIVYTLGGADSANYLAPNNDTVTDGEITPKQLTITGTSFITRKVYDGTDTVLSITVGSLGGVVPPDDVTVSASGNYDNRNYGTGKTIRIVYSLDGADAYNYIVPVDSITNIGVIARQLTITGTTFTTSKVYDGTDTVLSVVLGSLLGIIYPDSVEVSALSYYDSKDVGTGKTIRIVYTLSGTDADNYFPPVDSITIMGEITAKPITVTVNSGQSKTYGDPDPDTLTYTVNPHLIVPDTFTGTLNRDAGENIGKYEINLGTFDAGNNYAITFIKDSFEILSQAITVIVDTGQGKTYGDPDPPFTYTVNPALVGNDTFTGTLSREAGENIGKYEINQGTLDAGSNYDITFVADTFAIVPKTITITADAGQGKTYGDPDPPLTYTVNPALVGNDTFTGTLSREAGENTGKYEINQGTLDAGSNYDITFVADTFAIVPKTITVTADTGQGKTYGDPDPPLTYTVNLALVGNDTFTGALSRYAGENVGKYEINEGTLDAGYNYDITFVADTFAIVPKTITIKANGGTSFYGDNPVNPEFTATGLAYSETESVLTGLSNSFSINNTTPVGIYELSVIGTLTNPNYHILARDTGTWIVEERQLVIRAIDETIGYGQIPELKYEIVSGNLVNGDVLSGDLYVENYEIGIHPIEQGTLTASSNYQITFEDGTLIVLSVDVSIDDIIVNGTKPERSGNHFFAISECGENQAAVTVVCDQSATVTINGVEENPTTVSLSKYGDNNFNINVTAQNGNTQTYTLTINKQIPFDQVVIMRWNNTLTVINNPANNGGFTFTSFTWYCNNRKISTDQSWSVSPTGEWINPNDEFYVELIAEGYSKILRTCKSKITLRNIQKLYPNPVAKGQILHIATDMRQEELKGAILEVYEMTGKLIETRRVETQHTTSLQIPIGNQYITGVYLFVLKGKDGRKEEMKVIVY